MPIITQDIAEFAGLLSPRGRLIALDVGTKTLGVAFSDVTRLVATPDKTIVRTKFTQDSQALLAVANVQNCVGFVLGLPLNLDGSSGPRVQATQAFARALGKLTECPMLLWDERLSTVAAERAMLEADASRRRRAERIDSVAAAIILQGALERLKSFHAEN